MATQMLNALNELCQIHHIDEFLLLDRLEQSLARAYEDMLHLDNGARVTIDRMTGKVYVYKLIPKGEPDPETGEYEDFDEEDVTPKDTSRIAAIYAKQEIAALVREAEKKQIYAEFSDRVGDVINGVVLQSTPDFTIIKIRDGVEAELPHFNLKRYPDERNERPAGEHYLHNQRLKALIIDVRDTNNPEKTIRNERFRPTLVVSRSHPELLRRLFELEVPEIHDGLISIRAVARIPGERAKIAVESYDDRIDPVGACVGVKGSRIHGIVRELRNENIDVINFTTNPSLFIQRALSPARISTIRLDEEARKAEVFLRPEEVSLAIGKNGHNIKLATMLTGSEIDVYRDTEMIYEDDIFLDDFRDEIDAWVIDTLKNRRCVTAKSVRNTPLEVLIEQTYREENTIDEVFEILNKEYEDEEPQQQPEADADSSRQQ